MSDRPYDRLLDCAGCRGTGKIPVEDLPYDSVRCRTCAGTGMSMEFATTVDAIDRSQSVLLLQEHLADILDRLPEDHPSRSKLVAAYPLWEHAQRRKAEERKEQRQTRHPDEPDPEEVAREETPAGRA